MDIQKKYQKDTGTLLPTAGNTLDIGPGITHKRDVVELYAKGYNPIEIARKTDHNLNNVETYIDRRYGTSEGVSGDHQKVLP